MCRSAVGLPPLPCRASPPQGGRSARGWVIRPSLPYRNNHAVVVWGSHRAQPISTLVGEMPGRAEGGATRHALSSPA
ncbi:hypothetical protein EFB14_00750 [Rhizobium fabae]|uniref:Uncharacterized protein n=1 Tax=Rhizobium fabae TaxID=573179 RepID=A0ABY0BGU9_9HYPH|nr:hypothetical protein EFB14_00750 [Rhizobium fabae]